MMTHLTEICEYNQDKKMGELKSSVKIYCRLRPLGDPSESNCVVAKDEKTIILVATDGSQKTEKCNEDLYSFQRIFNDVTIQKEIFDHVAYPLVQDLLKGKNGLILTHGISSSGKTYTMTGTPEDEGLIPRSLDVIFNTIQDYQASKFVFKPNKLNGFEVQSTAESLIDQQKHLGMFSKTSTPKRNESIGEWSDRVADSYMVDGISSDRRYSIFISYVEIYNNYIYDLLEDVAADRRWKNCSSKMLREDSTHNMYVFGAVESEVKTTNEALELFCKGNLKRKFSNTSLNNESSRSHTVFTIRVVQAPVDPQDSEILQNQDKIVSQLSFVDLASCERTLGTKVGSRRSHETGSTNATLTVLNSCIEALMKSRTEKMAKMVPYHDSKLTHLFKMFFEGRGEIRMIVCINPSIEDYNETKNFMKFAEITKSPPPDIVTMPKEAFPRKTGRSDIYREVIKKAKQQGVSITEVLALDTCSDIPQLNNITFGDESAYTNLIESLKKRRKRRKVCKQDLLKRQEEFRKNLISVDKENIQLKQDKQLLEMDLHAREEQLHSLEHKLSSAEQAIESLEQELMKSQDQLEAARMELHNKNVIISEQAKEVDNAKSRMKEKLVHEKYRLRRTMERKLASKQTEIERKMCFNAERFRQLKEILNADDWNCLEDANATLAPSSEIFTSTTETSESKSKSRCSCEKSSDKKSKFSNARSSLGDFLPGCKTKKSSRSDKQSIRSDPDSHFDKESELRDSTQSISSRTDKKSSSRTHIKKLSTFPDNNPPDARNTSHPERPVNKASITSFGNAAFQYLLRGSCSKFLKAKKASSLSLSKFRRRRSDSDDVWLEHRPIGNLELNDFVPPILKKTTVSSLSVSDVTQTEASHYVLQHQELDKDGELVVELYKADIIPSCGGGAQVVFKDVVKMLKTVPRNHYLKRKDKESVSHRELEERCTISIECHGLPSKNMKKK